MRSPPIRMDSNRCRHHPSTRRDCILRSCLQCASARLRTFRTPRSEPPWRTCALQAETPGGPARSKPNESRLNRHAHSRHLKNNPDKPARSESAASSPGQRTCVLNAPRSPRNSLSNSVSPPEQQTSVLDGFRPIRYNPWLRPSGGMADAAVSKTVVSRRASSTLASGTMRIRKNASRTCGAHSCL